MEATISTQTESSRPRPTVNGRDRHESLPSRELALAAVRLALEKKGGEIKLLDLRKLTSITDYFLICTGNTDTHVQALADHIVEQLELRQIKPWHVEGRESLRWVLIDYVDVVVHIFQPEVREFYGLERLWGDAEIEEFHDETGTPPQNPAGMNHAGSKD
ncbi:MAG: ribosome silencing factor [candidate division KSB1 bacterium]|nr:ribosome silencing factor [candidate division KSB1 bacterium]MDZ7273263.1 ribosome silencing factor [candidate division KSB1 bacterium]MDZ7285365.1 ribosome silencing factor [candidate division KSB1 bacterium]MDZ7298397.1 ribosome silencing factor [candidate division KSB1 bacterium]MDZ7306475.1 ribosome silencing factor [candidate division KSB1 bacterium]